VPLGCLGIVLSLVASGMKIINGSSIFCTPILSAVKSMELGSDRISWGHWFDVPFLRAHAPTEDKSDDSRGSLCQEITAGVSSATTHLTFRNRASYI
jgi:hypothetical protein